MDIILLVVSLLLVFVTSFCFSFFFFISKFKTEMIFLVIGMISLLGTVYLFNLRVIDTWKGAPCASISAGNYTIVGIVEVSKDKQRYYQMILEQEGEVKLYTLPKDMIVIEPDDAKPDTLTVIEKSGLRIAVVR